MLNHQHFCDDGYQQQKLLIFENSPKRKIEKKKKVCCWKTALPLSEEQNLQLLISGIPCILENGGKLMGHFFKETINQLS